MKTTKNIARHPFVLFLALFTAIFALEPVALARVDPSWIPTGNLNSPRSGHTATLLPNGKVLVVGGDSSGSAELYDPATGTWSVTSSLNIARHLHTTTLLPNGKVLVAGGTTNANPPDFGVTKSAELYDPTTGQWSTTGSLNIARFWHTATLLQNGKVLVAGGAGTDDSLASAELYDPSTGTWSVTGSLIDDNQSGRFNFTGEGPGRYGHTATLLQNGKVLVAGGSNSGDLTSTLASAELYDPSTGTWSFTGNLNASRISHTATLLPDGKVLVAGGYTQNWVPANNGFAASPTSLNLAELYDPATGTWSAAGSLNTHSSGPSATLLRNGRVLVTGGFQYTTDGNTPNDGTYPCGVTFTCRARNLQTADVYDPATGSWSVTLSLNTARSGHTATPLHNGQVLVAGGNTANSLSSAELYDFPTALRAAVLPSSRSVQVGASATAFATILNADSNTAPGCTISPLTNIPATFAYQTTNPATNQITSTPNTAVDIPAGAAQSFVMALTPTAPFPPTDVQLSFHCANTDAAPIISGLNTFLFSASATPVADILALVATLTNDGIVNIPGSDGSGIFAVATVNMGSGDAFTVSADTGGAILPVNIFICQTDPQSGVCLAPPSSSVSATILSNETPTFGLFVAAAGDISFYPEANRIFVRFKDSSNITRASTSVAVRTQ
jgi:N-acetylneuraminic acid mutarotase